MWRYGLCLLALCLAFSTRAAVFQSPVSSPADLDPAATAVWADGMETPLTLDLAALVWTQKSAPTPRAITFGVTKTTGPRHLRIGLLQSVTIGTVLVRGNADLSLSVLKADAAYPGTLADEQAWVPATRQCSRELSVWTLPPGTQTRALRFSYSQPMNPTRTTGQLIGVYPLSERYTNLSPDAVPVASVNQKAARLLTDGTPGDWRSSWDNGPEGGATVISPQHPEWVMLVWPSAVTLRGFTTVSAVFGTAEIQEYIGNAKLHPREAPDTAWRTVTTVTLDSRKEDIHWLDLGREVTTQAIRLRITAPGRVSGNLTTHTYQGKRIWLGELIAYHPQGTAPVQTTAPTSVTASTHPPIPIRFTLKEPGYVTLVIDDANGKRIRNLVSETYFPAGQNIAWWDGMDDLGRDQEAATHGIFHLPGALVQPGTYRVRGLYRKQIDIRYDMSVYNPGNPPWPTEDHTGGWLADHTPPSSALFIPGPKPFVILSAYVVEGGDGLAFVDLTGKKFGGIRRVGGNWTGASHLTRDTGEKAVPEYYAYTGAGWSQDAFAKTNKNLGEIRLVGLTENGPKPVLIYKVDERATADLGGLAVYNGLLVASRPAINQLFIVDVAAKKLLSTPALANPRGLGFDRQGRLLALSGTCLLRFTLPAPTEGMTLPAPQVVIADGLDNPQQIALDANGNIYISDRGNSHQVKVFTPDGKPLRTIGEHGTPQPGRYNPRQMHNPNGLTITGDGRLWVAESDSQPKRVSVWSLDGAFLQAFYGPPQYGGGGTLDSRDKTRFYYNGMEFKLDWDKGTSEPVSIFYQPDKATVKPEGRFGPPETPIYANGQQYFTNSFNSNPTAGAAIVFVWQLRNGMAVPVAGVGQANNWSVFKGDDFTARLPEGASLVDIKGRNGKKADQITFAWTDLNGDAQLQPEEVSYSVGTLGSVVIMPDFTVVTGQGKVLKAAGFTAQGAPIYQASNIVQAVPDPQRPTSSGGGQALLGKDGWMVLTTPMKPFAPQSVGAAHNGIAAWAYPSLWPGLHASHSAAMPSYPGELIGTTRLLGYPITPRGSDAGELWAINGNKGNVYLFTMDGLFVATLFKDCRTTSWSMPVATRGMLLNDVTIGEEDFWPSLTQTNDGAVHLLVGVRTTSTLVSIDGLESIRRLPDQALTITKAQLVEAENYYQQQDALRVQQEGRDTLRVAIRATAPVVDGTLDEWEHADWAMIDRRITKVGDWGSKPDIIAGAVAISGDRLYAAFRTNDPKLLRNTGEDPLLLFKTGGALDLMIGTNAAADASRKAPVAGDVRLLVTLVNNKPMATLYRPVVPGAKDPVPFSSPWRMITFDKVENVSAQVQLAAAKTGEYELSIPLATLGLTPKPGAIIQGDLGLLRGDGIQTIQRVYWQNKATTLTSDIPGEVMLTPNLWGRWEFATEE